MGGVVEQEKETRKPSLESLHHAWNIIRWKRKDEEPFVGLLKKEELKSYLCLGDRGL